MPGVSAPAVASDASGECDRAARMKQGLCHTAEPLLHVCLRNSAVAFWFLLPLCLLGASQADSLAGPIRSGRIGRHAPGLACALSEAAGHVIGGALVQGTVEQGLGGSELHQVAQQEESGVIGHAHGLLHVVGYHDHGVVAL